MRSFRKSSPRNQVVALGIGTLINVPTAFAIALVAAWIFPRLTQSGFWMIAIIAYVALTFVIEPRIVGKLEAERKD